MGNSTSTGSAANVTVTSTTETVLVTSNNTPLGLPGGTETYIICTGDLTPGTGQTSMILRIRRGSGIGGAAPYTSDSIVIVAANNIGFSVSAFDASPVNLQYSVTVQQAGGAGNSTVNQAQVLVLQVAD
jgi:hypothetical protein